MQPDPADQNESTDPIESDPASPGTSPRSLTALRGAVTLALLVAASWAATGRAGLPRPAPGDAADTSFSADRALATVREIARAPHPTGSPEHERVRETILARLRALGLEPHVQTAPAQVATPRTVRAATVRNVVARLPGASPTGAVLVTAHYDSRHGTPGAADDGSGVAVILESLKALLAEGPPRNDVIALLTDAHEVGLLGARAFVEGHPWMADVSIVVSLEMRGAGGRSIMFETRAGSGWVVRALRTFAPRVQANSLAYEVYQRLPNDTDFTPFKEAGTQGLNFAAIGRPNVYHQASDTPDNLSEATLQDHGDNALGALRYLGGVDLAAVSAPDVVYFDVPLLGLMVYGGRWVGLVSVFAALLFVLALVASYRAGARPTRIALAGLLSVVAITISAGAGLAVVAVVRRVHPEYGSLLASAAHSEGPYVVALAAAVFAVTAGVGLWGRNWASTVELSLGAVSLPLVAAVGVGLTMPLAAMNLQWPVIAALASILYVGRADGPVAPSAAWLVSTLSAMVVLLVIVPVIELLWLAMSLRMAAPLAILIAVAVLLCFPVLESLSRPNRAWAPACAAAVALGAAGIGLAGSRATSERPAPSTLVYAYQHGSDSAFWATARRHHPRDPGGLAWAVSRSGGDFTARRDLSGFGYFGGAVPVATAPLAAATRPEVAVVVDSVVGSTRRMRVAVRSTVGAEMIQFRRDEGSRARLRAVNELAVPEPESVLWVDHWGEPDGAVLLDLDAPVGDPLQVFVVEHLLRPAELLGSQAFARPPNLAPNVVWMSDRAMLRTPLAELVPPSR